MATTLHQQLVIESRQRGTSVSGLVSSIIEQSLTKQQRGKVGKMYRTLKELDGAGGAGGADASSTIDELLYGEKGAWRGKDYAQHRGTG